MSESHVHRVKELLDRVRQAAPERRADMLAEVGRLDPDGADIAAEVQQLLDELESAGEFLETAAGAPGRIVDTILAAVREGVGDRIGPYLLLEQIGEGGFGVVYLAEQEHPIRRRVALKVIKLGMDTRQVIARFEQERQALAIMDHPGIAKVLDAGSTASGRPYFVMELVRGLPITRFCDEHRLGVRDRLTLFASVCDAVQHAHQKGIIHRDLKPSNILVVLADGDHPSPKVIDFGIAKATQARLAERTVFTELRQLIGTPEYMSPEQAGFVGATVQDIDTRSDVYSLGVLLYELLTGVTPFDPRSLRDAAFDELRRVIREVDPPRPSTRLSTVETLGDVAARRDTEPNRLREYVRGELDWIVMRCLEKDRVRRYASAADLARDVSRHLNHEALEAAPPSAVYRVRKFIRRHRRAVLAAAAFVLTLVLGLVGTSVGGLWAWNARNAAMRAEARALDAAKAEAVERARADDAARLATRTAYQNAIGLAAIGAEKGSLEPARASLRETPPELRGWEWSHLSWACDPTTRRFDAPDDTTDLAISGDGARLFVRSRGGELRVLRAADGALLRSFRTPPGRAWRFRTPQASHDGSLLMTVIADHEDGWTGEGTVTLWDVASGVPIWTEPTTTLLGASFSDGRWRRTPTGAVRLDLRDEAELDHVEFRSEPLHWVFGPIRDSRIVMLVTEGAGWNVLWNLDSQREVTRFGAYSRVIVPASPPGIVAVSADRVSTIDARSGATRLLPIAVNDVRQLRSVGENSFGIQHRQGQVRMYSWPHADPMFSVNVPIDAPGLVVDASGTSAYIATRQGPIEVRGFASSQPFSVDVTWRGGYAATICPTGRRSAVVGWGSICVFDTATGENLWSRYPSRDALYAAAFSADGSQLAAAGRAQVVTIFDAHTGDVKRTLPVPGSVVVTGLAWSHRGDRLLAGLWDGRVFEYDPAAPERQPDEWSEPAASSVTSLAFAPGDEHVLVVARGGLKLKDYFHPTPGSEQSVRLRRSRGSRETVWAFNAARQIRSAVMFPSESTVAVAADDSVILLDATSGREMMRTASPQPSEVLAISPDERRVAAVGADDQLRLFDASNLAQVAALKCLTWSSGRSVTFSPSGDTLLVADAFTPVIAYETGPTDRAARRLRVARVRAAVDRAFLRSDFVASRAMALVESDPDLSDESRLVARELVAARGDDPNHIQNATLLRIPSTPPGAAWEPLVDQMHAAVRALPDDPGLRVTLGVCQLRAGRTAEAVATAQFIIDALQGKPQERAVWAWCIASLAHSSQHDPDRARAAFDRAMLVRQGLAQPLSHDATQILAEAEAALATESPSDRGP